MLGYPHPDFLLPKLTLEQWREWQLFLSEQAGPEASQDVSTMTDSQKLAEIKKLEKFGAELAAKKRRNAGLTNEPPIVQIHG